MATGSSSDNRAPAPGDALTTTEVDTSDWPAQAAETIERVVGQVRWVAHGLVGGVLTIAGMVLWSRRSGGPSRDAE
jgi:hypothetical protein